MAFSQLTKQRISLKSTLDSAGGAGALTGAEVDCQGYDGILIVINIGALGNADNTGSFTAEESNTSGSGFAAVAAADLDAALPAINSTNDLSTFVRNYIGKKRFLRINRSAIAGTTAAAQTCVQIARSYAVREPVTQG